MRLLQCVLYLLLFAYLLVLCLLLWELKELCLNLIFIQELVLRLCLLSSFMITFTSAWPRSLKVILAHIRRHGGGQLIYRLVP